MSESRKTIPALTLWQPWATLIAIGVKRIETRSWQTSYRGLLAIHAGRRVQNPRELDASLRRILERELGPNFFAKMPRGEIIAIAELVDCIPAEDSRLAAISKVEHTCGNYGPGRFGWQLENVVRLEPGIAAKGVRGLWSWQPPAWFEMLAKEPGL
jgi:hypothetical protein